MPTVILLRHGRTTANASGVLAGWSPGVKLDAVGHEQVRVVAQRLTAVPLAAVITSPLQRCRQTAAAVVEHPGPGGVPRPDVVQERDLGEVRYGTWTGRRLGDLAKEPLWRTVQDHPSAARFPDGESLAEMQSRSVAAIRRHDQQVREAHGENAIWLAVSHGDVIKAILADALGSHLDTYQRIVVDTASLSIVRYSERRPFVLRMNDRGEGLGSLAAAEPSRGQRSTPSLPQGDAAVGGGSD